MSSASAPVQLLPAALPPPAPPPPTPEQSVVVDAAEYGNGEALLGVEGSEADPPPTAGQAVSRAGRPTVARAPAARGAATKWCDVVGKRVTTGDCGRLREQRDALQDGVGGMDVPPSMFVGDRVDLLLVVGRVARAGRARGAWWTTWSAGPGSCGSTALKSVRSWPRR